MPLTIPALPNPLDDGTDAHKPFKITAAGLVIKGKASWVVAEEVVGDGTTDDTTALQAAINSTPPGGTLVVPVTPSAIRISAPIDLIEQRTYVFAWAGMWPYRYLSSTGYTSNLVPGTVKATAGFSGDAMFRIRGNEITSRTLDNDGIALIGLLADCSAATGNIDVIRVEGLCRDLYFERIAAQQARGTGNCFHFLQGGTGEAPPRGLRMKNCVGYNSSGGNGYRFNGVTDAHLSDLLAVSNGARGFYFTDSGENNLEGLRAVFNGTDGFFFDGSISVGQTTLVSPATDRNGQNGINISQTGNQPIQIVSPRLRRDGSASTTANYAALKLTGSSGSEVVPVEVVAGQSTVGVDDGGGGLETPQWGVRAVWAKRLNIVGGEWWGVDGGYSESGTISSKRSINARYFSGNRAGQAEHFPTQFGTPGATTFYRGDGVWSTVGAALNTYIGTGSPEGVVTATQGSLFLRTDGGVGTALYRKVSGSGNTGWQSDAVIGSSLKTADHTLGFADAGALVEMNLAGANNVTVPANATTSFATGTVIEILQYGAGQTTIVAAGGVTLRSASGLKLRTQYSSASLRKRATDEWVVTGDLVT